MIEGQMPAGSTPNASPCLLYKLVSRALIGFASSRRLRTASGIKSGATFQEFEIPPTFFQSWWFVALCTALALAALWLPAQAEDGEGRGADPEPLRRTAWECERIAHELHDTLLQRPGPDPSLPVDANKMPAGDQRGRSSKRR